MRINKGFSLITFLSVLVLSIFFNTSAQADRLHVAVASNFYSTLNQLSTAFKDQTGHDLIISAGSTGQLYAQTIQGAPFDVVMAADVHRPELLVEKNLAEGLFIYAQGQLSLLVNTSDVLDCDGALKSKKLKYLAIANPELAPFGAAAQQYLERQNLWQSLKPKLVMGENVSQAMHLVASGNASAGLVASSLLVNYELIATQCVQIIENTEHQPINQGMVLLKRSNKQGVYKQFMKFLSSKSASEIITNNGYRLISNQIKNGAIH